NQFFGGLGGEEKAGAPLEARDGAVGPGKLLEQLLGAEARVVLTLVCGDNYALENQESMIESALEKAREANAELLVAGPCFLAGRYGMAAGALCAAVQSKIGIPVITGMARENPGADLYRESLFIIDSGDNAAQMPPGLKDLRKAKLMLITDGGLVRKGNPDKIQGSAATRWGSYSIKSCDDLKGEDYEISHGGYDAQYVRQDPDRLVPLDVMR